MNKSKLKKRKEKKVEKFKIKWRKWNEERGERLRKEMEAGQFDKMQREAERAKGLDVRGTR